MKIKNQTLARKYAAAFLNLYDDSINMQTYEALNKVLLFFNNNQNLITYFKLPGLDVEKKEVINKIFDDYKIPLVFQKLSNVLLEHKRLFLLPEVLSALKKLYCLKNNIIEFKFIGAHSFTVEQVQKIKNFLEKKIGATILYNEVLDRSLIAGIRLLSDNYLWEYSIAQQLRDAQQALLS